MAMRYGYFDSEITGVDENGMPIFDRAETSDLFRMLFANLVSSGVLASPEDCFQVVAGTGMTVRIRPGFAMIKGAFAYDADEAAVTLAAANANLPRLDRVVLRCNYRDRLCEIIVKTGTPASVPAAPEILQPENGDYYEIGLASIIVAANQTIITQSSITDTRADSSVCGFITQLIDHIDTSEFMQQLTAWQEEYSAERQAEFEAWFNAMKNQLSEDAAGNLQMEIDSLTQSAEAHDESIGQINEIIGSADMGSTDPTIRGAIRDIFTKIGSTAMGTTATTVTGAIGELFNKIGNVAMGTTATTITGAIKELKSALAALQGLIGLTTFKIVEKPFDNISISPDWYYDKSGYNVTTSGYRAIAIAGFGTYPASSGGVYANWCLFQKCILWRSGSTDYLDFYVWNQNTSATAKVKIRIWILYVKSGLFG